MTLVAEDVAQLKTVLKTHVEQLLRPKSDADLENSISFVEEASKYLNAVPEAVVDDQQFREWLVSRLLLSWPWLPSETSGVPRALAVILDVLVTIKPIVFAQIIKELIHLLHTLVNASDALYDCALSEVEVQVPFAQNDPGTTFKFDDAIILEDFQTQLTRLFSDHIMSNMFHMVDKGSKEHLMSAFLRHIEVGEAQLKVASIMAVNKLVNLIGTPLNRRTTLRLYDTLFAMATLLSNGEENGRVKHAFESIADVEVVLAECFQSVLNAAKLSHGNELQVLARVVIDFWERVLSPNEDSNVNYESLSEGFKEVLSDSLVISIDHLRPTELRLLRRFALHDPQLNDGVVAKLISLDLKNCSGSEVWSFSPLWKSAVDDIQTILRQDTLKFVRLATYLNIGCLLKKDLKGDFSTKLKFLPVALVTETSQRLLEELLQSSSSNIKDVFDTVSTLSSNLLCVQTEKKVFHLALALITMPFMHAEQGALMDLKVPRQLSKTLVEKSRAWATANLRPSPTALRHCIKLLSSCPSDICPKWRFQIYHSLWSREDGDTTVRRQALLEFLPRFVCSCSKSNGVAILKRILPQILEAPEKILLLNCLAKIAGKLVCVLSSDAKYIKRNEPSPAFSSSMTCRRCDLNESFQPHKVVPLPEVEMLLKLVGCEDDLRFKSNLSQSLLKPLSNHVGFDRSMTTLWITYYEGLLSIRSALELRQCSDFVKALVSGVEYIVKPAFSKAQESHSNINGWIHQRDACDTIMSFLEEASKGLKNETITDALVLILVNLCRTNVKFLHQRSALTLFTLLLQPESSPHVLALAKDVLLTEGLRRYKGSMMLQLAVCMNESSNPTWVFKCFCTLIQELPNVENLMSKLLNHLVVHLFLFGKRKISSRDKDTQSDRWKAISSVAVLMKVPSWPTLLMEGFHVVLPLLVINTRNDNEYKECVEWLEQELTISFGQLVSTCRQKLTIEIIEHFHSHQKQMVQLLHWVVLNDKSANNSTPISKDDIVSYVAPKLLGVLGHFDQRLSNFHASKESKTRVLLSLQHLIRFMGPSNISDVKHKIMSALRMARVKCWEDDKDVIIGIVDVWEAFVKTICNTRDVLGPILPELLGSLVDLLDTDERSGVLNVNKQVVKLVRFIVMENSAPLQSWFSYIHFLPETTELAAVNNFIRKKCNINEGTEFKTVLQFVLNSLDYENLEVKVHTLKKLKQILRFNQGKMQGLIFMRERCDRIVSVLTSSLLNHLRDFAAASTQVSTLASQCLGFIGAVDPGRLDTSINVYQSLSQVSFSPEECSFGSKLLSILIKAYLSALGSSEADACAFSIQEVLKCYRVEGSHSKSDAWINVSEANREVAAPFFTSLYAIDFRIPDNKSKVSTTVFEETSEYHEWLFKWYLRLCSQLHERSKGVFEACLASVKKDAKVAEFLIPYIIMSVLLSDDKNARSGIHCEIESIIEAEASTSERTQNTGDSMLFKTMSKITQHVELERLAMHTVFAILDHLNKWLREKTQMLSQSTSFTNSNGSRKSKDASILDEDFSVVSRFVNSICQRKLAYASFHCQSYARSLLHLEKHLSTKEDLSSDDLFLLQATHAALLNDGNSDYVVGVSALRKTPPKLSERLQENLALSRYQDALACYSGLATGNNSDESNNDESVQGMIRCYLETDQPLLASALANAHQSESLKSKLRPLQLQAAWELEQWDVIEETLNNEGKNNCKTGWESLFASLMLDLKQKQRSKFNEHMEAAHNFVAAHLGAAAMEQGPYRRAYNPHVVRLQILNEIQVWADHMLFSPSKDSSVRLQELEELLAVWHTRSNFSQDHLEAVQKARRSLLTLTMEASSSLSSALKSRLRSQLSMSWLATAKAARRGFHYDKAYSSLLRVEQSAGDIKELQIEVLLERAKLLWSRELKQEAIVELRRGVSTHFPWAQTSEMSKSNAKDYSNDEVRLCGKTKLLLTRYLDDSGNAKAETLPICYSEARTLKSRSEDACYFSAKFYDKIVGKMYEVQQLDTKGDMVVHVISNYSRSLLYGCRNIDQSLPRMLSLWLDYGARVAVVTDRKVKGDMENSLRRMNEIISRFSAHCPAYFLLLVMPQLTSRILHPTPSVFAILSEMLIKTFLSYPHQTFWHIVSLVKSSVKQRRTRAKEILQRVSNSEADLKEFVDQGLLLADALIQLAECEVRPGVQKVSKVAPLLQQLLAKPSLCSIPNTRNSQVLLPTEEADRATHKPFEGQVATIASVDSEVTVMRSMICPKKVVFRGSDGKKQAFLCKPKDDLRRDCRLMDFNNLLNKIFMRDQQARIRDLRIRTYHVVPLNETSGLIEWVPNLEAIRPIISKQYRNRFGGNPVSRSEMEEFQRAQNERNDPKESRKNYEILLKKHPSIFGEWFVQNYPDPHTWYLARLAFTRTTAVMSMVGFLLGLGDRHLENIMIDVSSGDTVHVDLNCLFNKGDELKVPEVVPFRLTHNMVHAMGPTGVEGPFRVACEVSLGLMRAQMDVLMSALRPFYFDPLVDWLATPSSRAERRRQAGQGVDNNAGETVNQKAVDTLLVIQKRLDGYVGLNGRKNGVKNDNRKMNKPLSVAGQVNHLIEEATSHENLSQMYLGWAPYF